MIKHYKKSELPAQTMALLSSKLKTPFPIEQCERCAFWRTLAGIANPSKACHYTLYTNNFRTSNPPDCSAFTPLSVGIDDIIRNAQRMQACFCGSNADFPLEDVRRILDIEIEPEEE